MLESIQIKDFQAHHRLQVSLDPKVTTIIGPSDAGKTAILRALRWVVTNQPAGTATARWGSPGAAVRVSVDGHHVTRSRRGDNTYNLDGSTYAAPGRDVPDDIAKLFNMPDVCWQGQHQGPWWLDDSPAQVAKGLNKVVDLSVVDQAVGNAKRAATKAAARYDAAVGLAESAQAEADQLAWVADAVADWDQVQAKRVAWQQARSDMLALAGANAKLQRTQTAAGKTLAKWAAASNLQDKAKQAGQAAQAAARLRRLVFRAQQAEQDRNAPTPNLAALTDAYTEAAQAQADAKALAQLVSKARQAAQAVKTATDAHDRDLAKLPRRCPLCGK